MRVLVLNTGGSPPALPTFAPGTEVVQAGDVAAAVERLQNERFDALYADVRGVVLLQETGQILRADQLLELLGDGVVVVDADQKIIWANDAFRRWCGSPPEGRPFYDALDCPEILGPDYNPFHTARGNGPTSTCLQIGKQRLVHFHLKPLRDGEGRLTHFLAVGRDVTTERQQQQKLDAIHRAGAELAALDPSELTKLGPEERIELLKSNVRRYAHELLHYDVLEVRLLDPTTGKLEPLLMEGMTPEAAQRVLYAKAEDNGVTGFVATTGKSYLCPNTAEDPLYLVGAAGAKSSLTVPLIYHDQVIGTFNVESPQPGAFTREDQQFLEIFSRQVANAVHTLELLVAEQRCTANASVEAISREVALPVDDILQAATGLLDRYIGHDPEMSERLQTILRGARSIKQSIQKVGDTMAPAANAPAAPTPQSLRGKRVLVADNDDRVRRSAHTLLGRFGCVVETARDGREAAVMARLGSYDLMLADIRLPDMDGYEVFRKLQAAQPDVPVVLMSAYGYDPAHAIVKARQEGLRAVLFKPFRVDQLLELFQKVELSPTQKEHQETLRRLEGDGLAAKEAVDRARRVWAALQVQAGPRFPQPRTTVGGQGQLNYVWDTGRHHLAAELFADGRNEWFYRDLESGQSWAVSQTAKDPLIPPLAASSFKQFCLAAEPSHLASTPIAKAALPEGALS